MISLAGETLVPLPSGALWWPGERLLAVSDLHLGRAERTARLGGGLLPPYETEDTLERLAEAVAETRPRTILSLGDSFDDLDAAGAVGAAVVECLSGLAAGRHWIWIAGNHDPGPVDLPGSFVSQHRRGPLVFRHIAQPGARGEISGHYHPKMRLWLSGTHVARPCFLADADRVILPAFGTYTGGLDATDPVFDDLFGTGGCAWLTGRRVTCLPRLAASCRSGPENGGEDRCKGLILTRRGPGSGSGTGSKPSIRPSGPRVPAGRWRGSRRSACWQGGRRWSSGRHRPGPG